MPVDQADDAPAANVPQNDADNADQTIGEMFMEAVTAVGSTMRSTFVEANRCVRNCVYPAKQRCIQLYDDLTSNFSARGTRNVTSVPHVSRFGNDCGVSE
ncbi:mitochondrial carrier protein, putative [Babesia ovata]|uniref:Mitochondrial carrier protein, putative n=1 Tax=Babesia ovata TaxID=189622 RepID=A0A2H6KA98_9APIC|nr:mitochondrial carrier protein, putative [Babesia ovata]GBE59922.1 mitochondrial carrier protein, putative [Babesia ovata]